MLKKLRIKFVALIMAMVAVVLFAVFSTICVINYQQAVSDVYSALTSAIDHDAMPKKELLAEEAPPDGTTWDGNASGGNSKGDAPFEIGGRDGKRQFIPVAVYEVSSDGTLTALSGSTTASIADETLAEAAAQTADEREGSGLLSSVGLYYSKHSTESGTYIAFADKSSAESWQTLALTLAAVGVGALLIFFVISLFFSKWALGPVEASWRKQQQFVADASHELKTPLTVMLANTSILLKHPEKSIASQSQWVESVETEAELMQRLVGDLLFLATPNAARREYALSPTGLSDIIERNLLQFESVAFEREITVDSEIEEDITVMGNAVRLERLVSTLLDNAYKYAEDKGRIGVTLKHSARRVELAISNSGTSIDPTDLPHIFDRFYRADKARERSVGGYGLGLAIAHEVAEEHGGTISAHSSESGDTVFTVVLPIEK